VSLTVAAVRDPRTTSETQHFERILLASEGRQIPDAAIERALELARGKASVHVFSIARVHGVSFGLPMPGLLPTRREWLEQRDHVARAVKRMRRKGIEAEGHVLGTRNATKKILEEAKREHCDVIVMGADPDRSVFVRDMIWSQEPQRVRRKAKLPVILVVEEDQAAGR
jgi:nucleotide-binding universal stress UspA family protein